jgi:hypothetical protein
VRILQIVNFQRLPTLLEHHYNRKTSELQGKARRWAATDCGSSPKRWARHPQLPYLDFALGEARDGERPYGEAKVSLDALAMSRKLTGKNDLYTIAPGSNSASTISSPSPGWPNPAVAVHANTWSPSAARAKPAPRSQERARWRHIDARFHQRRGNVPNGLATLGCLRDPPWTLWRILCISASTSWKLSFERRSLRSSGGTEYL